MKNINKVIICGNLGQDPQTRKTTNGGDITNLSVGTSKSWKDQKTNEWKSETEWHRVVCYDGAATVSSLFKKGDTVYIQGELKTRQYQQNGVNRYITEILVKGFNGMIGKMAKVEKTEKIKQIDQKILNGNVDEDDEIPF